MNGILLKRVLFVAFLPWLASSGISQNLLNGPQKIVIDTPRNRLLVSNYDSGNIVQIDYAGNQTNFVKDAGFVDGLEIVGDTVYGVGNDRKIRAYNLITRQLVMDVTLPGNTNNYLSSITSDSAGHLFISCPELNIIYKVRISDHTYWVFAQNNGLNRPNGILLEKEKNRIVVINDSPGQASIHAISLEDSTVSMLISTSFNRPDGIVRDKYGYYYVGGYYLPGLYQIDPDFSQAPTFFFAGNNIVYPTYDKSDHSLLITHYNANTWERVPLTSTGTVPVNQSLGFFIHPVSPNPFQTSTTIKFELDKHLHIRLDIYDSTGILIKTLVNEEKESGSYSILWDGKNSSGEAVAKGLYYCRLSANGITQTQKAILFK
jgi:hypothetical protein